MVKTHLSREVGDQCLTFEEFTTLLCQIESILKSRPMCAQSSDGLTPGHFLTLEPLNSVTSEPSLSNISRLFRWQLIQKLHADFWKISTRYNKDINGLQIELNLSVLMI